jgi:hypothetical protein
VIPFTSLHRLFVFVPESYQTMDFNMAQSLSKKLLGLLIFLSISAPLAQASDLYANILSMRERAQVIDDITEKRIDILLPRLMKDTNIDMWLMISREYNEDPTLKTFLPATWISARRTTILIFVRTKESQIEAFAVAPYKVGKFFQKAWDKKQQPNQWKALLELIERYDPQTIGVNQSEHWAHADGLVASDKEKLLEALPTKYQRRIVSAEKLAVAWLEQRIPQEMSYFKSMTAMAHQIIAEGFSAQVVIPGTTTSDDLVWWFREKVRDLNLTTWFHPSVSIQREDDSKFDHENSFTNTSGKNVILKGDLLHVDFGLSYLRLNTDTQQHAYILKDGEQSAPEDLQKALTQGNFLQDIFTGNFKRGKTGNEVLSMSLKQARDRGLKPTIYTHPLGYHGHAAGTTLGMWDSQEGVPGSGDYPLHENTAYSIELNTAVFLDSWNKEIRIMLEEDAFFDSTGVWYLDGRQKQLILIGEK